MSQTPHHLSDDTSDRLYTPEELDAFAAAEAGVAGDRRPTGPGPAPPAGPPTAATYGSDPLTDPLPPERPAAGRSGRASPGHAGRGAPAHRAAPSAAGPPGRRPAVRSAAERARRPARRAARPVARRPALPGGSAAGAPPAEPRRFMTATDFLDRRADAQEPGPASWGWRGRVRRWSGGSISPKMGPAERAYEQDRALIQKDFDGPVTIAFINPKGGAAKTTGVLAAGYTFGTVRGGGVVAWDNNETRGTLGIRGTRSSHTNTTKELLADLGKFSDVSQSRIGDLGSYVRSQGDAHFDVLASDESANVTGQIHADDFNSIHQLMMRFYRVILVDTGNNMRAENWLAAADAADLLVVTSTVREDTGYSGLWMLDALQDAGYQNLKYKTVTVLSDPSSTVDTKLAADLVDVYQQRTRGVYRVPYDPALVAGSVLPYAQLSESTRMSWLRACAGMASAL